MSLSLDEAARIEEILGVLSEIKGQLRGRESQFIEDLEQKYNDEGADMFMSAPMWSWLESIYNRFS